MITWANEHSTSITKSGRRKVINKPKTPSLGWFQTLQSQQFHKELFWKDFLLCKVQTSSAVVCKVVRGTSNFKGSALLFSRFVPCYTFFVQSLTLCRLLRSFPSWIILANQKKMSKKFVNLPENCVDEALDGLTLTHSALRVLGQQRVVVHKVKTRQLFF